MDFLFDSRGIKIMPVGDLFRDASAVWQTRDYQD